ncbi:MAG: cell division protein FtsX [Geminicoccaceae bacterium]
MRDRATRRRDKLLRPAGFDELGLRRALSDRLLPFLVAAMAFLAALALAGAVAAASLADRWRQGAGAALTIQVPRPSLPAEDRGGTRLERVTTILRETPAIGSFRALSNAELSELLRPWLGAGIERLAVPLPAVIEAHLKPGVSGLEPAAFAAVAPGTLVESHDLWLQRLSSLARSLQACAALALLVVAAVAVTVVAVATRAGLSVRRQAIEIVHGLGATDGYIAARFATRACGLAAVGGCAGAVAATPILIALASLAAPVAQIDVVTSGRGPLGALPPVLWLSLPGLPAASGVIGFVTAQATVRRWLRRLP